MSAICLDLQSAEETRDIIHRAVAALAAGKIIAFPTETVYGLAVSALVPEAVERLLQIKGRDPNKPIAFAIKSLDAALDYVPDMPVLARRLARRCWPGPVTLVLDCTHRDSVIHRLDPIVQEVTVADGKVGLRVPANEHTLQVLQFSAGPILLTSANLSGQPESKSGQEVMQALGDQIDLVLDDGPCRIGQASSVVYINKDGECKLLREGIINAETLKSLSEFVALVVCTGNTCRSPMGEAILRGQIAERLECHPDDLASLGINVISAGTSAMPGAPAAPQAIEVMKEMGLELSNHQSQPISARLASYADLILTMTGNHKKSLVAHWPNLEQRTSTVRTDGGDISDPIGAPIEVYRQCANQIREQMTQWVDKCDLSQLKRVK